MSLGVKAKYGDCFYLAKNVNEALREFKEADYPLPKEILNFETDMGLFTYEGII